MKTSRTFWTKAAIAALAALITASVSFGQEPVKRFATLEQKIEYAKKNYLMGLRSDNTGLVESCIKMVAKTKLLMPKTDTEELQEQLDELSVKHPSAKVRYKAYIVSNICANPEWFAQELNVANADEEQFFINAAQRLQQKLLGASSF